MSTTANYPELVEIGDILLALYDERYGRYSPIHPKYVNTPSGERTPETIIGLMGVSELTTVAENDPTPMQTLEEVYKTTVAISKRARGFYVSEETVKMDRSGRIRRGTEKLAVAAQHTKETVAASLINNMIVTNHATRLVPLASNSQPLAGGGTFDNRIDGDLSIATLDAARIQFRKFVDDRNLLLNITPKYLVHTPDDERVARQILGSDREPFSADHNINTFKQDGITPITNPFLTDADNAALVAGPEDNGLYLVIFQDTRRKAWVDQDTDTLKFKATGHWTAAFADFRGFVGVVGA